MIFPMSSQAYTQRFTIVLSASFMKKVLEHPSHPSHHNFPCQWSGHQLIINSAQYPHLQGVWPYKSDKLDYSSWPIAKQESSFFLLLSTQISQNVCVKKIIVNLFVECVSCIYDPHLTLGEPYSPYLGPENYNFGAVLYTF